MQRERHHFWNEERAHEREAERSSPHRRYAEDFRGGPVRERDDWNARAMRDRPRWESDREPYGGRDDETWFSERPPRREPHEQDEEGRGLLHRMGEGIRSAFGMSDRERFRGPHFGKGPKGFKRSDERIREDVSEAIARQGWIDATDVEVRVQSGEVILSGTVAHREDKRALERMIEDLPGVVDVHNEIRIPRRSEGLEASGEAHEPRRDIGRNARHS